MNLSTQNSTQNDSKIDCYIQFYKDPSIRWTFIILLSIFILFTLIGNILVCLALAVDKSLRTAANIFLINMSLGDVFVTVTITITDYAYLLHFPTWRLGSFGNWVYNVGFVALLIIPFLSLIAVTCDRYVSIIYPFRYIEFMTKKRACCCVIFIWIYTSVITTLISVLIFPKKPSEVSWEFMLPMNTYYLALLLIHTLLPLFVIVALYFKIYTVARRHRRQINALKNRFGERGLNVRFMKAELKATRTVLIVVIVLALSWLPFIVNETLALLFPNNIDCGSMERSAITNYLTYFNGAINPLVYSLRHRRFLVVFKKILCCKRATTRNITANIITS